MALLDILGIRRKSVVHQQSGEYLMQVIESITSDGKMPDANQKVLEFAKTYFPPGCEFYHDGKLTAGGVLVAMAEMERLAAREYAQEPCKSCRDDTCQARLFPYGTK